MFPAAPPSAITTFPGISAPVAALGIVSGSLATPEPLAVARLHLPAGQDDNGSASQSMYRAGASAEHAASDAGQAIKHAYHGTATIAFLFSFSVRTSPLWNPLLLALLKNRTLIAIFEPRPQTAGRQLCVA